MPHSEQLQTVKHKLIYTFNYTNQNYLIGQYKLTGGRKISELCSDFNVFAFIKKSQIIDIKHFWFSKMKPRVIKTANSKGANSEDRLY